MEAATEAAKLEVLSIKKQTVRQFINRIDEIVMFTPLSSENITKIVGLANVTKMLA
jgi:ATP-dependent Clp protease ATP-binding subunit ClpB